MSNEAPPKPQGPWHLNGARIMILIFGAVILVYLVSGLMGGLGNYQQLKEAAQDANGEQHDPSQASSEPPGL